MKNRYRIVTDSFYGYEAQVKYWWFPFVWYQMGEYPYSTNTHSSVEAAEKYIADSLKPKPRFKSEKVKDVIIE